MECDKFGSRPMQALTDISRVIRRCNRLDGSTRSRLDGHLDDITALFVSCDNLYQTPIPIEYTRHTERFLGIWLLLLPLGFAHETKGSFDAVPMAAIISLFLFGIEELSKVCFVHCILLTRLTNDIFRSLLRFDVSRGDKQLHIHSGIGGTGCGAEYFIGRGSGAAWGW